MPDLKTKPVLGVGSEFEGGKVVAIKRHGVLTATGEHVRFHLREEIENQLTRKRKDESLGR